MKRIHRANFYLFLDLILKTIDNGIIDNNMYIWSLLRTQIKKILILTYMQNFEFFIFKSNFYIILYKIQRVRILIIKMKIS